MYVHFDFQHWIEVSNVVAAPFKLLGEQLETLQKRLQQGVQARATKLKFEVPSHKKREYTAMVDTVSGLHDEDHPEFAKKPEPQTKKDLDYNLDGVPEPEPGSEEAKRHKKHKCKKGQIPAMTVDEETKLEIWKQGELMQYMVRIDRQLITFLLVNTTTMHYFCSGTGPNPYWHNIRHEEADGRSIWD